MDFKGLPDVLPIKPKDGYDVDYAKLVRKNQEEQEDNELLI